MTLSVIGHTTMLASPQGIKLGPILFLIMVNDLASSSPLNLHHWIFVNDLITSETVPRLEHPKMQPNIINLETWSESNYMKLNPKKCKEMCVCFLKNKPDLQPITIYGNQIERLMLLQTPRSRYPRRP